MIGRGVVQANLDGRKVAVQVTSIEQDFAGVLVRYMLPGILFPRQATFRHDEWDDLTVPEFVGKVAQWTVN